MVFSNIAACCIAHDHDVIVDQVNSKKTQICKYKLVHKLAVALDLLLGITVLVTGILSVAAPHLGISLSPAAQWALIGAGGTYMGLMLLVIGLIALICLAKRKAE